MPLYLPHHDVYARLLCYDPDTGAHQEIARAALGADAQLAWGFYVNHEAGPVGVYDPGDGPVFFVGAQRYRLSDYELRLERRASENCLRLVRDGTECLCLRYRPPLQVGTHPWDDEAMADFYVWLVQLAPRGVVT
ncbi:MAG: hypothetical protein RMK29_18420 [Myxococcales bacterium]|nr:hypothetical protein [Myxococcota bacterium]MDW8283684.1 hypothetical protein [Myxococcales bacterium]